MPTIYTLYNEETDEILVTNPTLDRYKRYRTDKLPPGDWHNEAVRKFCALIYPDAPPFRLVRGARKDDKRGWVYLGTDNFGIDITEQDLRPASPWAPFCAAILCDIAIAYDCGEPIGIEVIHERSAALYQVTVGVRADLVTFTGRHHQITFHTVTGRFEVFSC